MTIGRRQKCQFEKNKIYYYPTEDWKIKFISPDNSSLSVAATQYVFKVIGDQEWDEFITALPNEIWKTKTEYLKSLKIEKNK